MMLRRLLSACLVTFITLTTTPCVHAAGEAGAGASDDLPNFYRSREDGWFWYKDPPPPPPKPKEDAPPPTAATPAVDPLLTKFEAYKKALEQARVTAFFEPTPRNVGRYATLQTDLVKRSSEVSDVWQRVIWANPQFDFTQERPVNRAALNVYEAKADATKRNTMERLATSAVLYFFFRSDCPYCHEFAPTLARFSRLSGIQVFPITLDGGVLADFPRPVRDNGIATNLGVTSWPALYLAEPGKRQITPVGFGVMSELDLAERLVQIINPPSSTVDAGTPRQAFNPFDAQ
jgi:conjugal transfer pilus assembly protein TraF